MKKILLTLSLLATILFTNAQIAKEVNVIKKAVTKEIKEQIDKIFAEANKQVKDIRNIAKKSADEVRKTANEAADELEKEAKNKSVIEKKAAKIAADKTRKEGEAKAKKIEDESEKQVKSIMNIANKQAFNLIGYEIFQEEEKKTGIFKIQITEIPENVIKSIRNGAVTIGMGPVNSTLNEDGSNAVAGRSTSGHGEDEVISSNYYEFYMYPSVNSQPYIGVSGIYDIGFANFEDKRVTRNFPLVINSVNIIPYDLFIPISQ